MTAAQAALVGTEDFSLDQQIRSPLHQVTNSFFGTGTQRDLLCSNPQATNCGSVISGGIWTTAVPQGATFTQASVLFYVPPFDVGYDVTLGGSASRFDLRIRSTGTASVGLLFDKYAPLLPSNRSNPSVEYISQTTNTAGEWLTLSIPFSAFTLRDGATSAADVLSSTNSLGLGVVVGGAGNQVQVDYLQAVHSGPSPVPLPATAWLMLAGIGAIGVAARRRPSH